MTLKCMHRQSTFCRVFFFGKTVCIAVKMAQKFKVSSEEVMLEEGRFSNKSASEPDVLHAPYLTLLILANFLHRK